MKQMKKHPEKTSQVKQPGGAIKHLQPEQRPREYVRFHWTQRVAHALLLISFTMLGITGLPQKYALTGWARGMIAFFGFYAYDPPFLCSYVNAAGDLPPDGSRL